MAIADSILGELDQEFKTTRRVLEAVPMDKAAWKPHEKSMSLGQLATHVAQIPGWGGATLQRGFTDFADFPTRSKPKNSEELLAAFDEGKASLAAALKAMSDAELAGTRYVLRTGDKVMMDIPKLAFLRVVLLNHHFHHRGQLSVYLRLLDVKVPAMYGPSADENPWG